MRIIQKCNAFVHMYMDFGVDFRVFEVSRIPDRLDIEASSALTSTFFISLTHLGNDHIVVFNQNVLLAMDVNMSDCSHNYMYLSTQSGMKDKCLML